MDQIQRVLSRLERRENERLERIEALLTEFVEQKTVKEWYTTAEVAHIVGRSNYCVREWARKGQAHAVKSANGRGWLISHEELTRLRNEGPIPEHLVGHLGSGSVQDLKKPSSQRK